MRFLAIVFVVLLTESCATESYEILDAELGSPTLSQCSRWVPDAEVYFRPSLREARRVNSRIDEISDLSIDRCCGVHHIENPGEYFRQYVGYEIGGRRFIYINAMRGEIPNRTGGGVVNACDGGSKFLGVSFDLESNEFVDLAVNGSG